MLTIRLDKDMEKDIDSLAKQTNKTKSELVRECLAEYIVNYEKPSAWKLGEELFGKYSSGKSNLAKDRKQLLTNIIKQKRCKKS